MDLKIPLKAKFDALEKGNAAFLALNSIFLPKL
jgi:hypothetical protein